MEKVEESIVGLGIPFKMEIDLISENVYSGIKNLFWILSVQVQGSLVDSVLSKKFISICKSLCFGVFL